MAIICEKINEDHQMKKAKALYSELAIARGSATFTCAWQGLKGRQRVEEP